MRTCSPYVALPFDPGRERPELVGFLLHPVSRSETWRRLVTHASFVKAGEVYFQASQPGSWRRAKPQAAIAWRTCPGLPGRAALEETKQRFDTQKLYSIRSLFSSIEIALRTN